MLIYVSSKVFAKLSTYNTIVIEASTSSIKVSFVAIKASASTIKALEATIFAKNIRLKLRQSLYLLRDS